MKTIKIDANIVILKLKNSEELKICKSKKNNLVYKRDVFTHERYNVFVDAEAYCAIDYIKSLEPYFGKDLNREEMEQLYNLIQQDAIKEEFFSTCESIKQTIEQISKMMDKEDIYSHIS